MKKQYSVLYFHSTLWAYDRSHIAKELLRALDRLPILVLVGPRQSGKSTLVKMLFGSLPYVNLEGIVERDFAANDPRGFIKQFPNGAIIDEVQRVPNLLSEVQVQVDKEGSKSKFVLTGSENILLSTAITQSHKYLKAPHQDAEVVFRGYWHSLLYFGN